MVESATFIPGRDRFALADGRTEKISYFTVQGRPVRTIGGKGRGPGEFQYVTRIQGEPNGGLCAWDAQLVRITQFDSTGGVVGTAHPDLHALNAFPPSLVGFGGECSFVLRDERSTGSLHNEPEGMRRDTVRFLLFTARGSLADTLLTSEDAERWLYKKNRSWGRVQPIFGNELIGLVSASHLWVGLNDALRWKRVAIESAAIDTVRLRVKQRIASHEEVDAERQVLLDAVKPQRWPVGMVGDGRSAAEDFAKQEREEISAAPANTTVPAYDQAVPGDDGFIWVREFPMPGDKEARWLLLSPSQDIDGQVSMARDAKIIAGDRQRLLVLSKDTLDTPLVRVLIRHR